MSLGFLGIAFNSRVLSYDDEKTPLNLTGKKMLPIAEFINDSGQPSLSMNESLDIIAKLDQDNQLRVNETDRPKMEGLLTALGENIHSLCMPYWIWTPEFSPASRQYFCQKKEMKRGPLRQLLKHKVTFLNRLELDLEDLEPQLCPYYQSAKLSIADIMLAAHLWGLYIVPEFRFSAKMHTYLQTIKKECHFDYHRDFWENSDLPSGWQ